MNSVNKGLFLLISNNQEKPQNTQNQSEEEEALKYAECLQHITFDGKNICNLFKYLGYNITDFQTELRKTYDMKKGKTKEVFHDLNIFPFKNYRYFIFIFNPPLTLCTLIIYPGVPILRVLLNTRRKH